MDVENKSAKPVDQDRSYCRSNPKTCMAAATGSAGDQDEDTDDWPEQGKRCRMKITGSSTHGPSPCYHQATIYPSSEAAFHCSSY